MQLGTACQQITTRISDQSDARYLIEAITGHSPAQCIAFPERQLSHALWQALDAAVQRYEGGEPIAYITGEQAFWSLTLRVTPDVLIPRADTETLVEATLARLPAQTPCRVADLGTGSGAIALALASERPLWQLTAVERSPKALAVARDNAQRLALQNVHCTPGDWCKTLTQRQHAIVSNPPYIRADDAHLSALHDPLEALVPDPSGLQALHAISIQAPEHLLPGGWLLLEHGYDQGDAVRQMLASWQQVRTLRDLGGRERVTCGRLSGEVDEKLITQDETTELENMDKS